MRLKFVFFSLLILALASCNLPAPTAQLPTLALPTDRPTQPPTAEPLPTDTSVPPTEAPTLEPTAVPTQAPVELPGTLVEFSGVSFTIPQGLGTTISGQIIPASNAPDMPTFALNPAQVEITLSDYLLQNKFHQPRLIVSPIAGYQQLGQVFSDRFVDLLSVLATRPADRENLPFLPLFNAAQIFHTTPAYLDFQNGSGVRYLTQFDQAYMPITNHSLFYTFQGVTADGLYHVALILPVTNLSLPADESGVTDWQAFANNFPTYIVEVRSLLETSNSADFSPALAELDALVTSLLVQPVGLP
jgi:hypothetical protein